MNMGPLPGKGDFANVIKVKDLKMESLFWINQVSSVSSKEPYRREAGGSEWLV